MKLTEYIHSLLYLFFPDTCIKCGVPLVTNEKYFCNYCFSELPTCSAIDKDLINSRFYGKVDADEIIFLLHYYKGNISQKLIHGIKYKGKTKLGKYLGACMANMNKEKLQDIDMIVPIPIHWRRRFQRGYNQSEVIAKGIASVINRPIDTNVIKRVRSKTTQTKLGREVRWENVKSSFEIVEGGHLQGKNILLVDDVVTTGATSSICCDLLREKGHVKSITLAALAVAEYN